MMTDPFDDPLAAFELPAELMSNTLEHAISPDADAAHEQGHAVATELQRLLKGSTVEYGFPGFVTARLASGAVARCGGPTFGWMIDVDRSGKATKTIEVVVDDDAREPKKVAQALARILKGY